MATASPSAETRLRQRVMRRWRLGLLGILGTVGLCFAVMNVVGPTYTANAYILLTPPPVEASPNPYLTLGGIQPLTDVVARAMASDTTLAQMRQSGLSGSYTVARDISTNGPVLGVKTTATSAAAALKDLSLVVSMAGPELDQLQAAQSVPTKARVTPRVVSQDTVASASHKSQIRALVVGAVAGLLATGLGACLLDVLLLRRRDRADARARAAVSSEPMAAESAADPTGPLDRDETSAQVRAPNGRAPAEANSHVSEPVEHSDSSEFARRPVVAPLRPRRRPPLVRRAVSPEPLAAESAADPTGPLEHDGARAPDSNGRAPAEANSHVSEPVEHSDSSEFARRPVVAPLRPRRRPPLVRRAVSPEPLAPESAADPTGPLELDGARAPDSNGRAPAEANSHGSEPVEHPDSVVVATSR